MAEGDLGLPELPSGERDGINHGATAALAGWRPIETAPKDETVVLLFIPDFGGHDDNPCIITAYHDGYDGPHRIGDGWTSNDMAGMATGGHPTHWMPLPNPPTPA